MRVSRPLALSPSRPLALSLPVCITSTIFLARVLLGLRGARRRRPAGNPPPLPPNSPTAKADVDDSTSLDDDKDPDDAEVPRLCIHQ